MFKAIDRPKMKTIVLIGLILGSIVFAQFIPVEVTHSDAFKEVHGLAK